MAGTITHSETHTWRWVVWVFVPGLVLHEVTHAFAARRWADVNIDWTEIRVTMEWNDAPITAVIGANLLPTIIGYTIGGVALVSISSGVSPKLGALGWVWLIGNWLIYSMPTRDDITVIQQIRSGGETA